MRKTLPLSLWANETNMQRFLSKESIQSKSGPKLSRIESGKKDIKSFEKYLQKIRGASYGFTELNAMEYLKKPKKNKVKFDTS